MIRKIYQSGDHQARPLQKRLLNVTFNDFKSAGILKHPPFPLTELRQQLCRKTTKHRPVD